mmetsp:Transcript_157471/g.277804  ORF Transcript_157471/g.277804 Transcript_157471/m.277804 type:complete len:195 (+) Transcript_157471:81-665(+)
MALHIMELAYESLPAQAVGTLAPFAFHLALIALVVWLVIRCKSNDHVIESLRVEVVASSQKVQALEKTMEESRIERAAAHKAIKAALETSEACFVQARAYAVEAQQLRTKVEDARKRCNSNVRKGRTSRLWTRHSHGGWSDALDKDSQTLPGQAPAQQNRQSSAISLQVELEDSEEDVFEMDEDECEPESEAEM